MGLHVDFTNVTCDTLAHTTHHLMRITFPGVRPQSASLISLHKEAEKRENRTGGRRDERVYTLSTEIGPGKMLGFSAVARFVL